MDSKTVKMQRKAMILVAPATWTISLGGQDLITVSGCAGQPAPPGISDRLLTLA
jgi:hypothetical protein